MITISEYTRGTVEHKYLVFAERSICLGISVRPRARSVLLTRDEQGGCKQIGREIGLGGLTPEEPRNLSLAARLRQSLRRAKANVLSKVFDRPAFQSIPAHPITVFEGPPTLQMESVRA